MKQKSSGQRVSPALAGRELSDASPDDPVERHLYDPYGRVTVLDSDWDSIAWSASRKDELLFTGYRWSPETG
ncbi:MAG: hypothetical protein JJU36_12200 [Phycisphaeraceae bacterium]|nr:hypothetical protein [Phycisphaeraceae bacterium]